MTRKKKAYLCKKNRLRNKRLVKKYPWLAPKFHPWTGRKLDRYDYEWTWRDDIPRGWDIAFGDMMLGEIDTELRRSGLIQSYTIEQIKEKFGAIRLYSYGGNDEIDKIISKYEVISEHTCIECGAVDVKVTNGGWILPLCETCFNKHVNTTRSYADVTNPKDDGVIANTYTTKRWHPDGSTEEIVNDISKTVAKVRRRYEKRIKRSNRRL